MSAKHTPGPWVVGEFNPTHIHQAGKNVSIARCEVDVCYNEEHTANARLIAAAPELLETVKSLLGMIRMCGMQYPEEWSEKVKKTLESAHSVVAKATTPHP